jgi:predicted nucleotidyltransferase
MSTPDPLTPRRKQLQACLELHREIPFAYLHGSALEGLPYHDLDVALYLEPTHPAAHDSFDYEMLLSVELTQALSFPVDVHALNQAPLGFQHSAVQGELLLVRDADQLSDYLESLARRYMEFAPLGRDYLMEVLRG